MVGRRLPVRLLLALGLSACALLAAATPAIARIVEAGLVRALEHGVSGSVTYKETNHGRHIGQATIGVVGQGTISGKLSLDAKLAATVLGAVKGMPLTAVARGGSYVTRYDIDAKGNHRGLVVITFKASGLGRLCGSLSVVYGKFTPGKTDYVPSTGTFTTIGGDGSIAKVHASASFKQGEVTGSDIEQILAGGAVDSVRAGTPAPLDKQCAAVAKLAKP